MRSSACSFCFLIFSTMRCHSQTADTPQEMSSLHHLFSHVYSRSTRSSALKHAAAVDAHPPHHSTPSRQSQRSSGSCCRRPRGTKIARRYGISSSSPCSADGISNQGCCPGNRSKSPPVGSGCLPPADKPCTRHSQAGPPPSSLIQDPKPCTVRTGAAG
jgi:hypothetical protein